MIGDDISHGIDCHLATHVSRWSSIEVCSRLRHWILSHNLYPRARVKSGSFVNLIILIFKMFARLDLLVRRCCLDNDGCSSFKQHCSVTFQVSCKWKKRLQCEHKSLAVPVASKTGDQSLAA